MLPKIKNGFPNLSPFLHLKFPPKKGLGYYP